MRALRSDRQNCSPKVSQKVKRIRRFSDQLQPQAAPPGASQQEPRGGGKREGGGQLGADPQRGAFDPFFKEPSKKPSKSRVFA